MSVTAKMYKYETPEQVTHKSRVKERVVYNRLSLIEMHCCVKTQITNRNGFRFII
jgi:hypothetical protein